MTIQFKVPDMACGACAESIIKAVQEVDPQALVQADPETKQVKIETQVSESSVKNAIAEAGYTVSA